MGVWACTAGAAAHKALAVTAAIAAARGREEEFRVAFIGFPLNEFCSTHKNDMHENDDRPMESFHAP
jgi:hypothetical protein